MLKKGITMMLAAGCLAGAFGAQTAMAEEASLKIGLGVPFLATDFFISLNDKLNALAEADGNEVKTYVFDGDFSKQISQMEDMAADECDVILTFATTDAVNDTAKKLKDQGKTVVLLGGGSNPEIKDCADYMISQIDFDMAQMVAQQASDWVDATFPDAEDGSIEFAVISTTFDPNSNSNSEGLKSIEELNSKVKVVEFYDMGTGSDGSLVQSYANQALTAHPNLHGFLCYSADWAEFTNQEIINLPGADLSQYGIFMENQTEQSYQLIQECADGKDTSVIRGLVTNQLQIADIAYKGCLKELDADENNFVELPLDAITCENIGDYINQ